MGNNNGKKLTKPLNFVRQSIDMKNASPELVAKENELIQQQKQLFEELEQLQEVLERLEPYLDKETCEKLYASFWKIHGIGQKIRTHAIVPIYDFDLEELKETVIELLQELQLRDEKAPSAPPAYQESDD